METCDSNGNLATSTDIGVTTSYTWNVRNQLTGISRTGLTASFTYDSFGRRTGKTINGPKEGSDLVLCLSMVDSAPWRRPLRIEFPGALYHVTTS